jgi:hypothetical protein
MTLNLIITLSVIILSVAFFNCYAESQPAIIRLGWKDLPGTNTLAYYEPS